MSKILRIEQVSLKERNGLERWVFGASTVVLQGPVGVGKSSLLELIKHGFGGRAILTKTVKDVGLRVQLTVTFEAGTFILARSIGAGSTQVRIATSDGEPVDSLPVQAGRPGERTISHWLLEQVGIPAGVRLPRSRAHPRDELTQISFGDVFTYLYLDQVEIDRSTARDADAVLDPKRKQTFELLYGLLGPEEADLHVRIAEVRRSIGEAWAAERNIESFVARLEIPSEREIVERRMRLRGVLADVERALTIARREAGEATPQLELPREHVEATRAELAGAGAQRRRLAQGAEALARLRARISLDMNKTSRAMVAGGVLAGSPWEVCPRCLQRLEAHPQVDDCLLCGQPEPPSLPPDHLEAERERLHDQLLETDAMIAEAESALDAAARREELLTARLSRYQYEIDAASRDSVAPFVDRIADLTGDAARLSAELGELERLDRLNRELADVRLHRETLEQQLTELQVDLERAREHEERGKERVAELSRIFEEILKRFRQPWFEEQGGRAFIDPRNYRPVVNGQHLPEQGSGGMKVVTNLAYYLAGLTYALREPDESRLPTLLIIDTPRKNFGNSPDDRAAAERFYREIRTLRDVYGDRMQIVIADNDVPVSMRKGLRIRAFSYESPLIASVEHPGEGNVDTIGRQDSPPAD